MAATSALNTVAFMGYTITVPDWLVCVLCIFCGLSVFYYLGVLSYRFVRSFKKEDSDGR